MTVASRTSALICIERARKDDYTVSDIARATGFDRGKITRLLQGGAVEDEAALVEALVRFGSKLAAEGKPLAARRLDSRPAGGK